MLEEVNMVLVWSSNKLWYLVSGIAKEFGLFLDVGDTVAEVVIFVDHVTRMMEVSCGGAR